MTRRLINSISTLGADRRVRTAALVLYYLAIEAALFLTYKRIGLTRVDYIYQAF